MGRVAKKIALTKGPLLRSIVNDLEVKVGIIQIPAQAK